jgi:hypothetical protein
LDSRRGTTRGSLGFVQTRKNRSKVGEGLKQWRKSGKDKLDLEKSCAEILDQ